MAILEKKPDDARWSETIEIPHVAQVVHEAYFLAQPTYGTYAIRAADLLADRYMIGKYRNDPFAQHLSSATALRLPFAGQMRHDQSPGCSGGYDQHAGCDLRISGVDVEESLPLAEVPFD